MEETLDPAGFPIEMNRPVVFDEGGLDPHTELSETFQAGELGFPGEGFYNVPTIWEGKIYNTQDPAQFETVRNYVQQQAQSGFRFPNFPSVDEAVQAAQARSQYFNTAKEQMLRDAVDKQRQKLLIQMMGLGQ